MGPEIVIPVATFGSIILIVWLVNFYGLRRRA